MPLKIRSLETSTGNFSIALEGRLDTGTYLQLEGVLSPIVASAVRSIRFDLKLLDYISSMGLRVFLKTAKRVCAKQGKMVVTNLQPPVKKAFEIANALPSFDVFESVEEADRYLDGMQKRAAAKPV